MFVEKIAHDFTAILSNDIVASEEDIVEYEDGIVACKVDMWSIS